jgi:hypothetical protein
LNPENYQIEFLRFEVARFDCGYNAIIMRLGLAKFVAIPHYPYMILKMQVPRGSSPFVPISMVPPSASEVLSRRLSQPGPRQLFLHMSKMKGKYG